MFFLNTSFFEKYKTEIFIFCAAVLLRIIVLVLLIWLSGVNNFPFPVNGSDAGGYVRISRNLIDHGVFSRSSEAPFIPDSFRTPGYPFFLAFVLLVFKTIFAVPVIQSVITGFSVVLLYKIARYFLSNRPAIFVAGLFIIDPVGIYLSNVILSEILFLFLLLFSVYSFLGILNNAGGRSKLFYIIFTGILLALSTLVRPISLVLLPIFMVFGLFFFSDKRLIKRALYIFLLFAVFLSVIFPWSLRNKLVFNSWQLSTVAVYNLYHYHIPFFYASQNNVTYDTARRLLALKLPRQPFVDSRIITLTDLPDLRRVSVDYIKKYPIQFTKFYLIKTTPFFLTDGFTDIGRNLRLMDDQLPNFTDLLLRKDFRGFFKVISDINSEIILFLAGLSFWLIINFFMLAAVVWSFTKLKEKRFIVLFFFCLVLVMALASGPVSNARLRYPATPFMFTLAFSGGAMTLVYVKKWLVRFYQKQS